MSLRRARGGLLRLVRRRPLAIACGLAMIVPAAWVEFSGRPMPAWASGLALIGGATGMALLWTGLVGSKPDWVEHDEES